jgi:hypothetical protein
VLDASQSTYHADGKNSSAGVEVGVGYAVGAQTGVYAYVAANVGAGHSNSDGTTNNNTNLKADTINLRSKGDTTLKGAVATANTVNVDVGGKLAIESVQDTSRQESSQTNIGGRVQVSLGTAWDASGSLSQSKGSGSSTAVVQQSGLFAGDGGYHVKADTVELKGGAIASTSAENSALVTNKLTATNLDNKMNYTASSVSLAGGIGGASGKGDTNPDGSAKAADQQQLFGDRKSGNVTPGLPTVEKGGNSSTTYATLTDGKITIGGVTTSSVKDLAINTDAGKASTALDKLPELQAVLKTQQAMSAASGTVVATSKQVAGDIVANAVKTQGAAQQVLNDPNSTAEQKATATTALAGARQTAADWSKGGIYSRALDAGTTILVGSVAGQAGTQIVANAVAPTVAKTVGDIGTSLANEAHAKEVAYKALAEQATRNNDPAAAADYTAKADAAAATAANWGDNGVYRVGLHSATQGLLGELADGRAGALQSAAGVVGGNLGQQLGEKLGNAEADKLGLQPGAARDAFVNAYQQTGAVVGGLVAGATAAGASGTNGDALLAAARGGSVASTVDLNNRQLHKIDYANAKRLAALSNGKYTEKQILDAMRLSGVSDGTNLLVEPGHAEVYATLPTGLVLNVTSNEGWKPITSIADMNLAPVNPTSDGQLVLKEVLPAAPSSGLVSFIQNNSGGTSSPYVFAAPAPKSDYSGPRFPPAPPGTTRVTVDVGGSLYFPLRADCAQGCSDAVAHAIDDPGTRAYEKALVDQMKRDGVMFGLSLINPFQRGFGLVAGAGRSVAVGEVTGLAREAGAAGVVRAGATGEASVLGLFNKVGTVTSADIDAALQTATKGKGAITLDVGGGVSSPGTRASLPTVTKVDRVTLNASVDDSLQYVHYQNENGWVWPENLGFKGPKIETTLSVGTKLDRIGDPTGSFLSPAGTAFEKRALAPGTGASQVYYYEVVKPFPVVQGEIAPAFGQIGDGIQILPNFEERVDVQWLLDNGYLKGVKK